MPPHSDAPDDPPPHMQFVRARYILSPGPGYRSILTLPANDFQQYVLQPGQLVFENRWEARRVRKRLYHRQRRQDHPEWAAARRISKTKRRAIIEAWEATGRVCGLCGQVVAESEPIHVDHIQPVVKGGTADPINLRVTHARCNLRRNNNLLCVHCSTELVFSEAADPPRSSIRKRPTRARRQRTIDMDVYCPTCQVTAHVKDIAYWSDTRGTWPPTKRPRAKLPLQKDAAKAFNYGRKVAPCVWASRDLSRSP